ncbi:unnamed protein product [Microthlaspi erraticum]|uniref:Uncharacterized protein n=1 Tax=Microthlaspi erraticum TaxID=1685480 RepID=A0A6D2IE37_9BRAS|nr:unnamed protein product [Microthlaspi erraticum]
MEKKIDGKMKSSVASIPANYVSILQLQERWEKEKERKQKEKDLAERGVKQQVNGQGKREEEDVMKVAGAMQPRTNLEENGLGGGFRMDRRKKESKCVEVCANKEENGGGGDSRERKKKWSKKEMRKQGGSVEEIVECETKAEKIVQNRENAASDSIAVETQFQDLRIKKKAELEVKGPARLNSGQGGYYRNQKHDWSSTRVIRSTGAMVWVKKGNNGGAGGENSV